MDKKLEKLKTYVDYLERAGITSTRDELEARYYVENDPELAKVVKAIKESPNKEARLKVIEDYKNEEQAKKDELERIKQACSKMFGITLDKIEYKKLKSGIDVIAFHDPKLNRKRIIDYSFAKSLVTEFTNIQNNNKAFQSEDYDKNASDIAQSEAEKNRKRELDMVDIERAKNEYQDLIKRIPNQDPKKVSSVLKIIAEADKKNIKYINFENMVALDEKGNIIEAYYNENKKEAILESPEDYKASVDYVDNKQNVDDTLKELEQGNEQQVEEQQDLEQVEITPTDFEQEEEIVTAEELDLENEMKICSINKDKDEVYKKIQDYAANMATLDQDLEKERISKEEYEFYELLSTRYIEKMKLKKVKSKTLEYNPNSNESGSVALMVVAAITIIVSIIVLIVMHK